MKTYTKAEIDVAVAEAVARHEAKSSADAIMGIGATAIATSSNGQPCASTQTLTLKQEREAVIARIVASDGPKETPHPDPEVEAMIARIAAA